MSTNRGEQFRHAGRLLLVLFVLGAAAFLSAITAMRFAIEGRVIHMPSVVGQSYSKAQAVLQKENLGVVVADHVYSHLPVDSIVRQSPPPGTEVKLGQRAQVVLSLGPQKVTVPSLIDHSLPVARLQLLNAGLQLGEISYIYSAGEPADLILQQDPLPGETGLSSPRVSLLVSLGPRPPAFVMPDLAGISASLARQQLKAAGLQSPQITPVNSTGDPVGTVVGQKPAAGARVDQTTPILLSVASSTGPTASKPLKKPGPNSAELYVKMPRRWE